MSNRVESPEAIASQMDQAIRKLPVQKVPHIRKIRCDVSRRLQDMPTTYVMAVACELFHNLGHRWAAYELIRYHESTQASITQVELDEFGKGMDSWGDVDSFAYFLSGPAWLRGQIPDQLIHSWAGSDNRWWRRAALASTVVLNTPNQGGHGDVKRTLAVCRLLVRDPDDMVVKALSWALRKCVAYDPQAVREFLSEYEADLASRVKREVGNKLRTGLKNPRQS